MYFLNYGLPKTWLDECRKVPFQKIRRKAIWEMQPTFVEIRRTPPLPYLLITAKAIVLQKVSLTNMQNLKTDS